MTILLEDIPDPEAEGHGGCIRLEIVRMISGVPDTAVYYMPKKVEVNVRRELPAIRVYKRIKGSEYTQCEEICLVDIFRISSLGFLTSIDIRGNKSICP